MPPHCTLSSTLPELALALACHNCMLHTAFPGPAPERRSHQVSKQGPHAHPLVDAGRHELQHGRHGLHHLRARARQRRLRQGNDNRVSFKPRPEVVPISGLCSSALLTGRAPGMLDTLHALLPAVHVLACLCREGLLTNSYRTSCTEVCMHSMRPRGTLQPEIRQRAAYKCLMHARS